MDYVAPEMVTANQLYWACDDTLDSQLRNVVAADAWAVGAIIFYAATGSELVQHESEDTGEVEDYKSARVAYLLQVHAGWKVRRQLHPDWRLTSWCQLFILFLQTTS